LSVNYLVFAHLILPQSKIPPLFLLFEEVDVENLSLERLVSQKLLQVVVYHFISVVVSDALLGNGHKVMALVGFDHPLGHDGEVLEFGCGACCLSEV